MANHTKPYADKLDSVCCGVHRPVKSQILALSHKWGLNVSRTAGRMLEQWIQEHKEEVPRLSESVEGQMIFDEMTEDGDESGING
jgi:hypothetical protein